MNSACIAYAHSNSQQFGQVFHKTREAAEQARNPGIQDEYDEAISVEGIISRTLRSQDPEEWIAMFDVMEGGIPQELKDFVKKAVRNIKEPREETIEQHVLELSHNW